LGLTGLILWAAAGAVFALAVLAAALLAMVVYNLGRLTALINWLEHPSPATVPEGMGIWDHAFAGLSRMMRRQRQSRSRLSATIKEFRQAGAAMPDGLVILDGQDRIEWCNPSAESHFGLNNRSDAGQSITYLVRQPSFAHYLKAENYGEPLLLRPARGTEATLAVQLVPFGEGQKVVISRDITELERVETMRRDFIANVSHELRTPLTVLGGFLETIADAGDGGGEPLRRGLPLMMDQTLRMQRLVEDLLTLSRLESAGNVLQEQPVDVPRLVQALYQDAQALSAKRHRIVLRLETRAWLAGSEDELRSAFGNLISNAVRYTLPTGEVAIAWEMRDGAAVFSVRDTGIGIAPEHVPRITERFYRVDRGRSRETGGTGLGLAIVKHVLARHQARLEVASEPGRGSTFSVIFPAARILAAGEEEVLARSA